MLVMKTMPNAKPMSQRVRCFLMVFAVATLSACGGGGGGTNSPIQSGGCAGAVYSPIFLYGSIAANVGSPLSVFPSTNVPADCAGAVSFVLASGALPAGLSLNASTGVISGIPTTTQMSNFSIAMTVNGYSSVSTPNVAVSVNPALVGPPSSTKTWTMMVYIAGDNNLAEFAIEDLNELKAAATNPNINVVVQVEKGSTYANTGFIGNPGTSTYRGLVNGTNTNLSNIGNQNMGSAATLGSFITWSKANYPAQNYSLVLWSHGGGWKANKATRGALADETSGTFMSLTDIRSGISNGMGAGNKLAVLAFDACLMGQYEVAYELRSTANYLVSSEELVPGPGMPYTDVVNLLSTSPTSTPLAFATGMANKFRDSYASKRDETTMSVVDLSQMDGVHNKVLDFATAAKSALGSQAAVLNAARLNALTFGGTGSGAESIDIWRFADNVASNPNAGISLQTASNALKTSLSSAVVSNATTGNGMANAKGMAIYFPKAGAQYNPSAYTASTLSNTAVAGKETWAGFLNGFFAGTSYTATAAGDFAYYMTWTNPPGITVDIDLAVNEPRGNWASPSIGATSPNGFLSGDSYYSSQNFESYTAANLVEKGSYDVFANLYGCYDTFTGAFVDGSRCTTQLTLCEKTNGASVFTCRAPVTLDRGHSNLDDTFYNAIPGGSLWTTVTNNTRSPYWDWYYFGKINKSIGAPKGKIKQTISRHKSKVEAVK